MIRLITYANDRFIKSAKFLKQTALKSGCDEAIIYGPNDIDRDFYEKNKSILLQSRGAGYWLWKPYIIYRELLRLNDGDILIYSDAGICFVNDVAPLLKCMKDNHVFIMPFMQPYLEKSWTKRDIFVGLDCDTSEFTDSTQFEAGFQVIDVCQAARSIIKSWLDACQNYDWITDKPSKFENYLDFIDNRHDQSLFSLIMKKNGCIPFREPSQFGFVWQELYDRAILNRSTYGQITYIHRKGYFSSLFVFKTTLFLRWLRFCIINDALISYNEWYLHSEKYSKDTRKKYVLKALFSFIRRKTKKSAKIVKVYMKDYPVNIDNR